MFVLLPDCALVAEAGSQDLEEITRGKSRVLFVGLTCGLRHAFLSSSSTATPVTFRHSAGYVAGQLVYAMSQPHFSTALLGFNPG